MERPGATLESAYGTSLICYSPPLMVVGNAQISVWYRAWRTETMDCMLVPFFFLPQLRNLLGAGVAWVLSLENGLSAGASWFLAVLCSPALHHTLARAGTQMRIRHHLCPHKSTSRKSTSGNSLSHAQEIDYVSHTEQG